MSGRFVDQWFIAQINQHRIVLVVEPATKDIETTAYGQNIPDRWECRFYDEVSG
jgi:hypothetical protein